MFAQCENGRYVFGTLTWEPFPAGDDFARHQKNWRDPRVNFVLTWNFGNMSSSKKRQRQEESGTDDDMQGGYGGYE